MKDKVDWLLHEQGYTPCTEAELQLARQKLQRGRFHRPEPREIVAFIVGLRTKTDVVAQRLLSS